MNKVRKILYDPRFLKAVLAVGAVVAYNRYHS